MDGYLEEHLYTRGREEIWTLSDEANNTAGEFKRTSLSELLFKTYDINYNILI